MLLPTTPYCLQNSHIANKLKIQTFQVMNSRLSQSVPAHTKARSSQRQRSHPAYRRTDSPAQRSLRPGCEPGNLRSICSLTLVGLGSGLYSFETLATSAKKLHWVVQFESKIKWRGDTPRAYTKQGKRFQIASCHGAKSFYIIAKLGFGWLVFFNKLFRNISWSKPKERILIYPIPFRGNWIHLFRVSASSTFHSAAMWILLISLQNSQSPLVSLSIIQPPSNEKLLWSSLFASSPKNISILKKS